MKAEQVVPLLDEARAAGIRVWVAGGWAVDALVGRQTRPHADLDLAVDAASLLALLVLLEDEGFLVTTDWRPARMELTAPDGRVVDLHPVVFRADGVGVQSGLDGLSFFYAADGFGTGVIDGRGVPCLTARQQLRFRTGYPLRDRDVHDVALLEGLLGQATAARPVPHPTEPPDARG